MEAGNQVEDRSCCKTSNAGGPNRLATSPALIVTVRSFGEALPECGRPGNRVIDKLLRAKPISEEERLDLSVYIATMLKRVPHRRKKAYALIPATVEDTKQKLPHRLAELAARLPLADPEQALTEGNSFVEGILTSVPKLIEGYIRTPWPSENMVMAISR